MYDLQKANMWKRISAAFLDVILLFITAVGLSLLLSEILSYGSYSAELSDCYDRYEAEFGVRFDLTAEEYAALTDEELTAYNNAVEAFSVDAEANRLCEMIINLTLIIMTFSILLSYLLWEFILPLIFHNGQTVGKKVFGIGVMSEDGVRLSALQLFVRTILGKYTIETMIPVLMLIMIYFNLVGVVGIAAIALLLIVELVLLIRIKTRTPLHDCLARTVTVDLSSQMIFDTHGEMLAYKEKLHRESVESDHS